MSSSSPSLTSKSLVEEFCSNINQLKGEPRFVKNKEDLRKVLSDVFEKCKSDDAVLAGLPADLVTDVREFLADKVRTFAFSTRDSPFEKSLLDLCKNARAGITWADYAIASNGAIVEIVDDDIVRLASSLPMIHIALLPSSGILPSVEKALGKISQLLKAKSNDRGVIPVVSFISGPSKTSDIELKLLYGVHGPLSLYVIILGWL